MSDRHRDYAGELADAADELLDQIASDTGRMSHKTAEAAKRLMDARKAYRSQPQVTHTCHECERREREIAALVQALGWIAGGPTATDPTVIARDELEIFRKGREAKR